MSNIRGTKPLRILSIFLVATSVASPIESFAATDQQCVADCKRMGYQWDFCDSKCSYSTQGGFGGENALRDLARQFSNGGLAEGWRQGEEHGQRQRLIQEQIENQRLQNEILTRQLEAQGTPRPPPPTAAPTPQYGRDSIAAEPGDAAGLTNLGMRYAKGDGVPKDSTKAVELFRKAASQGNVGAMNNLGVMYAKGAGVEQSHTQAVWFYRLAAEKGHPQAQANLGYAYEAGWGVNRDYNAALVWYRKAASLGHEVAKQRIAGIESTLNQQRLKPQTNVAIEMKARLLARNEGCEIASIKNVQPPTGFSSAYEMSCSDSSIRKYNCNSSECSLVSVVPPMGSQTKSTSKWPNP